jgi:hypothetical protein
LALVPLGALAGPLKRRQPATRFGNIVRGMATARWDTRFENV